MINNIQTFSQKNKNVFCPSNAEDLINRPVTKSLYVTRILLPKNGIPVSKVVFKGIGSDGYEYICTGNAPGLSAGEHIRVNGTWQLYHDKKNDVDTLQIHMDGFEILSLESEESIKFYLKELKVPGCGEKTIDRIIAEYGTKTIDLLEKYSGIFEEKHIFNVSDEVIKRLSREILARHRTVIGFEKLITAGFDCKTAELLSNRYREKTEIILKNDPYLFANENDSISYKKIDSLHLDSGEGDPVLLRARKSASRILEVLKTAYRQGHTGIQSSELIKKVPELFELTGKEAYEFSVTGYQSGLGLLRKEGTIREYYYGDSDNRDPYVSCGQYFECEKRIAENLFRLSNTKLVNPWRDKSLVCSKSLGLSKKQENAVWNVFENTVSIITGGPGTGKSYITKAIYDAAVRSGLSCIAAAPTGKASKKLESSIFCDNEIPDDDVRPKTIHKLLGATGPENASEKKYIYGKDYQLNYDLIIIDEASMIDIELADALLEAVSDTTRIVFIGDNDQLPSVGPGNFFADIIDASYTDEKGIVRKCFTTTKLDEIFRQANGDSIIMNSKRINEGKFPVCSFDFDLPGDNFFFIETGPEGSMSHLAECVTKFLPEKFGLDPIRDAEVLVPINIGPGGTEAINIYLRNLLNPAESGTEDYAVGYRTFRINDKVMQTANDYDLGVHNGDVGYVLNISDDGMDIYFPDHDKTVFFTRSQAYNLTHAYAITVHKAQGAEYEAVVIYLNEKNSKNIIRRQFYTAVTRARKLVIIIGDRNAFLKAVNDEKYIPRTSCLPFLLASLTITHG